MSDTLRISDTLSLTPFLPQDKPNLLLYMNEEAIGRNTLRIPQPYVEADADAWLSHTTQTRAAQPGASQWAIRHAEAGLIGGIGCFVKTGWEGHEEQIGYWLAAPFRGQGLMTLVVRRLTEHLFEQRPNLVRIEAYVFEENEHSIRLLRSAGFEQEGVLHKKYLKQGQYRNSVLMAKVV